MKLRDAMGDACMAVLDAWTANEPEPEKDGLRRLACEIRVGMLEVQKALSDIDGMAHWAIWAGERAAKAEAAIRAIDGR